ncbi:rhamnulokinase family protein [Streptomyces sp. NPDC005336]|uniref:rhamnulokinase n=1 Tax=unclassified Streptomyces TaxID=2593676 RepID=UPI0033B828D0
MTAMLAVDLGAETGRATVGHFDGERLRLEDVARFPNVPVRIHGRMHWNVLSLFGKVRRSLAEARARTGGRIHSVGVDTWGIDFGLVDRAGRLLSGPVHYRDPRTEGATVSAAAIADAFEVYQRTGTRTMSINTLYQLYAMAMAEDPALQAADRLLFVPDLFHFWLSGEAASEYTVATTSECFDIRGGLWDKDLVERFGVPSRLLRETVAPGTDLGPLTAEIAEETGLSGTRVVVPASHDTASAVVAVPLPSAPDGSAFVSCGTWAVVGVELGAPIVDDRTFAAGLSNEGGPFGTVRLLRNVMGLWLLQECLRSWVRQGADWSYQELVTMAATARPHRCFIDTDATEFLRPDEHMPARVRGFCTRTGQPAPNSPAEVVCCVLESLAMRFRATLDDIEGITGCPIGTVHIVGGGVRNALLCQWTANATGRRVLAGPVEAASMGNLLVQAQALGWIDSLDQARELSRASTALTSYEPRDPKEWQDAYERYSAVLAT